MGRNTNAIKWSSVDQSKGAASIRRMSSVAAAAVAEAPPSNLAGRHITMSPLASTTFASSGLYVFGGNGGGGGDVAKAQVRDE